MLAGASLSSPSFSHRRLPCLFLPPPWTSAQGVEATSSRVCWWLRFIPPLRRTLETTTKDGASMERSDSTPKAHRLLSSKPRVDLRASHRAGRSPLNEIHRHRSRKRRSTAGLSKSPSSRPTSQHTYLLTIARWPLLLLFLPFPCHSRLLRPRLLTRPPSLAGGLFYGPRGRGRR